MEQNHAGVGVDTERRDTVARWQYLLPRSDLRNGTVELGMGRAQRRSWSSSARVLAAGSMPAARSARWHWAKVVMTPS
jgi:hypothetical protein